MTIGQFAARAGVSSRCIRHYEQLGLLGKAARARSGYRIYQEADLVRVGQIRSLVDLRMSLRHGKHRLSGSLAGGWSSTLRKCS